jgi:CDP-glucose 4,6-dehydratase
MSTPPDDPRPPSTPPAPDGPASAPNGPASAPDGPASAPDGPASAPDGPASAPDGPQPAAVTSAAVTPAFWASRRVLLTGHTGFKGAWLSLWLQSLGARLTGFSDGIPTQPSLYELARVGEGMQSVTGDIRSPTAVEQVVRESDPEIVIHMAAQSLVRRSFTAPRETYETNVMGTVNLLDAIRTHSRARVIVNVTSDKCYHNREWEWGYREYEPMGGHDPYSSSKGCAELVTDAFRRSFFSSPSSPRLSSARAGNVIGGGDWATDRLIPDVMRAALAASTLRVRSPHAIRPWQHVLNPLSGYLALAQALWESPSYARAFNFGPADDDTRPVEWIVKRLSELWPDPLRVALDESPHPHEAHHLKLDSSSARAHLGWRPAWNLDDALRAVVDWYRRMRAGEDMRHVTIEQIRAFQYPPPAQPSP